MARYKLTQSDAVHDTDKNISFDATANSRWAREYQDWLDAGNTPDPADPLPPEPTTEDLANNWLGDSVNRAIIQGIADSAGVPIGTVIANIQQAARGN